MVKINLVPRASEIFQNLMAAPPPPPTPPLMGFLDFAMMLKFLLVFFEYFLKYLEISWDFLGSRDSGILLKLARFGDF
jgi:hypothetical protein